MIKTILKNQRGISLVEVTVAAAMSVMVAVGVMQINTNATKSIKSIQNKSNIIQFKDTIKSRLSNPDNCSAAQIGGANAFSGVAISSDVLHADAGDAFNSRGTGADEFVIGEPIPTIPNWVVSSFTIKQFDNGSSGSVVGECNLEISLSKQNLKVSYGGQNIIIKIPMSCQVNSVASKTVTKCSSVVDADEEGHWIATADDPIAASANHFISFGGISGNPRVRVGGEQQVLDTLVEASLTLDPVSGQTSPSGKLFGMHLPDDVSIAFGTNPGNFEMYSDSGGAGTTLTIDGSMHFGAATSKTISGAGKVVSDEVITGYIGALNSDTLSMGDADDTIDIQFSLLVGSNAEIGNDLKVIRDVDVDRNMNIDNNLTVGEDLDVGDRIDASRIFVDGSIVHSSDKRFKKNIISIENTQESLSRLRGVNYFMRTESFPERNFSESLQYGVIAQEVEKVFPGLVIHDEEDDYLRVNYIGLIPILIQANNEQQVEIEKNKEMFLVMQSGIAAKNKEQDLRISELEEVNKKLQNRVDELEAKIENILKLMEK